MAENGVTHKELNAALGAQTARIIAALWRSEDKVAENIDRVSDRVTSIEKRGRYENIFASFLALISAVLVNRFTGGNG